MNILMISVNRETYDHRVTPIGVLYLAAALMQKGHKVQVLDFMFCNRVQPHHIVPVLHKMKPDLICISIRNINALIAHRLGPLAELEFLVSMIREQTKSPIMVGGAGYSLAFEKIMNSLKLDFGIIGEADRSLPLFVEKLSHQEDFSSIPGLVSRKEDGIITHNQTDIVEDLDSLPFQAIELIDSRRYQKNRGNIGVVSRKGCAQKCIYCAESSMNGEKVRLRSAVKVVDEIEYIIDKTGVLDFDFADTLFNVPRNHALSLCRELIRRNLKIRFNIEANPIAQDQESVDLLKQAGCIGIDFTVDSGSNRMLNILEKGFSAEQALQAASLFSQYQIPYGAGFLLGAPGENLESVNESIQVADQLSTPGLVYFSIGLRVFSNTKLALMLQNQESGKKPKDPFGLYYYLTDGFTDECAESLLAAYDRKRNYYISHMVNGATVKFIQVMSRFSNSRPTWKYGSFLNILERIRTLGRCPLYWDSQERLYKSR